MSRTAEEWKDILEDAVEVIESNYTQEQWDNKVAIDKARFEYVKCIYEEWKKAIDKETIIYDWDKEEVEENWYEWVDNTEKLIHKIENYIKNHK